SKIITFSFDIHRAVRLIDDKSLNTQLIRHRFGGRTKVHPLYLPTNRNIPMFHPSKCNETSMNYVFSNKKEALVTTLYSHIFCKTEILQISQQAQTWSFTYF